MPPPPSPAHSHSQTHTQTHESPPSLDSVSYPPLASLRNPAPALAPSHSHSPSPSPSPSCSASSPSSSSPSSPISPPAPTHTPSPPKPPTQRSSSVSSATPHHPTPKLGEARPTSKPKPNSRSKTFHTDSTPTRSRKTTTANPSSTSTSTSNSPIPAKPAKSQSPSTPHRETPSGALSRGQGREEAATVFPVGIAWESSGWGVELAWESVCDRLRVGIMLAFPTGFDQCRFSFICSLLPSTYPTPGRLIPIFLNPSLVTSPSTSQVPLPRPTYAPPPPVPPPVPRLLARIPPIGPAQPLPLPDRLLSPSGSSSCSPPATDSRAWPWAYPGTTPPSATATVTPTAVFSVASYNVLAQCLVRRDFFPWATREALKVKHRTTLLIHHLSLLLPSLLAMQEVDRFPALQLELAKVGYETVWVEKQVVGGSRMEREGTGHGVVGGWRKGSFRLLSHIPVYFDTSPLASPTPLTPRTGNVGQILLLAHTPQSTTSTSTSTEFGVIMTNCHLFWRPTATYERLRQVWVLCEAVREAREEAMQKWPELGAAGWPVIMCGDFNTLPTDPLYTVLTGQQLTDEQLARLEPCEEAWSGYGLVPSRDAGTSASESASASGGASSSSYSELQPADNSGEAPTSPPDSRATSQTLPFVPRPQNPHPVSYILSRLRRPGMPRLTSTHSRYTNVFGKRNRDPKWDRNNGNATGTVTGGGANGHGNGSGSGLIGVGEVGWEGEPPWTTYAGWSGTLDYVFVGYGGMGGEWGGEMDTNGRRIGAIVEDKAARVKAPSSAVSVTALLELPPIECVWNGIPNDAFPSDHVPVMCELGLWF
ncbi:hypothetical protein HDU93_007495 [Gonapodya sp. JEL0774]|nr:hypothetical protein HDU93_007495 [Gonapodya sp. JEL0774]